MKKDVWDPTRRDMKIATKMVLIFGGVVVITSVLVACISLALFNHGLLTAMRKAWILSNTAQIQPWKAGVSPPKEFQRGLRQKQALSLP